jgi:hypothetical protein
MLFPFALVLAGALLFGTGATFGSADAVPVALLAGLTLLGVGFLRLRNRAAGRAVDGRAPRPPGPPPHEVVENIARMHEAKLLSDEEFLVVIRGVRSWLCASWRWSPGPRESKSSEGMVR